MSVASFVASQRTEHGIPDALTCRELELSESWFYKWRDREPTARQRRQADLDAAVKASFEDPSGNPGSYGSARVWEDLVEARLAGVGQHGGGFDGPPGPGGPLPEAQATLADPPGQGGSADPGHAAAGLQRRGTRSALVRGLDRDPH